MTDNELLAKNVFGELTFEDVDYETNFIFNLNAKVKVLDSHIELKDEEGTEWYLTFLVSVNLENLSPKGPRS